MLHRLTPLLFLLPLAPLLGACSYSAGVGDPPSEPAASVLGTGSRIHDVFGPADWYDPKAKAGDKCDYPVEHNVRVTGVTVMAVDRFDEVSDGAVGNVYVEDTTQEPTEYQGMTVYSPAFTPPDLRVAPGDVLDLSGIYQEFIGPGDGFDSCQTLPEIGGTASFRFEGSVVPPKKVKLSDLSTYEDARRYLGMLVTIDDVTISNDPSESNSNLASGGRYNAPIGIGAPTLSNELFDLKNGAVTLAKGTQLKSVTGVVTFFYSFHIAPRSDEDLVPK